MKRYDKLLDRNKAALLIIDVQEKILNVMLHREELINNILKLVKGCKILDVPIYYTEQYPKGLGQTIPVIKEEVANIKAITKLDFSCIQADNLFEQFKINNISQIVVCGIESHVCVQQTVLDLLANGFQVNVAVDAVSSRKEIDLVTSLQRMSSVGSGMSTIESILFEFLIKAGTEEFKSISKIIK